MPKKVPLISVTVHRDNKPMVLPVGKVFAFTEEEVSEINAMVPGSLRDPVNEAPVGPVQDDAEKAPAKTPAKASKNSDL
jgi:hypothetical protein